MKRLVALFLLVFAFSNTVLAKNIEDLYPTSEGVYLVKGQKQIRAIQKMLEEVDVAFEMGDGYYDVKSVRLYIARDGSKVIGFIEKYLLYYTEDNNEVEVLVRYNAEGKRIGDLE